MTTAESLQSPDRHDPATVAAQAGDQSSFGALAERHRRELQLHCYRMLGSFEETEDLVQETFLRAWRARASFEPRSTFRAWLYRIATNACLDRLRRRPRTASASGEVLWLEPFPDRLLDEVADSEAAPEEAIVAKETVELAFIVAIQHLPPRQRAVLIARDVLGWSAKETATLLEMSVASANSALQRARETLRAHLPDQRSEWAPGSDPTEQERDLLQRYIDASEEGDGEALAEMMREDARFSMPPTPGQYVGPRTIVDFWRSGGFGTDEIGDLRCVLTRANRQPAVACYVQCPGSSEHLPLSLDVLRIVDGKLAEIVTFAPDLFSELGLPAKL